MFASCGFGHRPAAWVALRRTRCLYLERWEWLTWLQQYSKVIAREQSQDDMMVRLRHSVPTQTLCTSSYSNTPSSYNASGCVSQLYLWPTFWQIPLKLLTVSKRSITTMQMSFSLVTVSREIWECTSWGQYGTGLSISFSWSNITFKCYGKDRLLATRHRSGVSLYPVILFLDCRETQEASYSKSEFKKLQGRVAWATGICEKGREPAECVHTAHSCGVFGCLTSYC